MTQPRVPTISVGITCAPREPSYLQHTLDSLRHQPIRSIMCTVEPGTPFIPNYGLYWEENDERLGNWKNWLRCARLLPMYHSADYYIIAEDDVVFADGAIEAMKAVLPLCERRGPEFGFLSLYRSGSHVRRVEKLHSRVSTLAYPTMRACHQTISRLWGACAMVFSHKSIQRLSDANATISWKGLPASQERIERLGPAEIDGRDIVLNEAAKELGLATWFMYPSIVQHIGKVSTVANNQGLTPHRRASDYPQEVPK